MSSFINYDPFAGLDIAGAIERGEMSKERRKQREQEEKNAKRQQEAHDQALAALKQQRRKDLIAHIAADPAKFQQLQQGVLPPDLTSSPVFKGATPDELNELFAVERGSRNTTQRSDIGQMATAMEGNPFIQDATGAATRIASARADQRQPDDPLFKGFISEVEASKAAGGVKKREDAMDRTITLNRELQLLPPEKRAQALQENKEAQALLAKGDLLAPDLENLQEQTAVLAGLRGKGLAPQTVKDLSDAGKKAQEATGAMFGDPRFMKRVKHVEDRAFRLEKDKWLAEQADKTTERKLDLNKRAVEFYDTMTKSPIYNRHTQRVAEGSNIVNGFRSDKLTDQIAAIVGYVRFNDPGSTARPSEFDTVEQAIGWLRQKWQVPDKILGRTFTDKDFIDEMKMSVRRSIKSEREKLIDPFMALQRSRAEDLNLPGHIAARTPDFWNAIDTEGVKLPEQMTPEELARANAVTPTMRDTVSETINKYYGQTENKNPPERKGRRSVIKPAPATTPAPQSTNPLEALDQQGLDRLDEFLLRTVGNVEGVDR